MAKRKRSDSAEPDDLDFDPMDLPDLKVLYIEDKYTREGCPVEDGETLDPISQVDLVDNQVIRLRRWVSDRKERRGGHYEVVCYDVDSLVRSMTRDGPRDPLSRIEFTEPQLLQIRNKYNEVSRNLFFPWEGTVQINSISETKTAITFAIQRSQIEQLERDLREEYMQIIGQPRDRNRTLDNTPGNTFQERLRIYAQSQGTYTPIVCPGVELVLAAANAVSWENEAVNDLLDLCQRLGSHKNGERVFEALQSPAFAELYRTNSAMRTQLLGLVGAASGSNLTLFLDDWRDIIMQLPSEVTVDKYDNLFIEIILLHMSGDDEIPIPDIGLHEIVKMFREIEEKKEEELFEGSIPL